MNKKAKIIFDFFIVTLSAGIMALNIKSFIYSAGLLPGGFSGIALLLQEIFSSFLNVKVPFSVLYWTFNLIPAVLCFKTLGKKCITLSIWFIIVSGILTDLIPATLITDDILLCSIFGGITNGVAIASCLLSGATSGGTDFISIFVSEKTGKGIWNIIFICNCMLLFVFGLLFGWNRALYSIIFQYATTQVINLLYNRYQKSTLLIISEKIDEIIELIKNSTNHSSTIIDAQGTFTNEERKLIYSVISKNQVEPLFRAIKKIDPDAFVNVISTQMLKGKFFLEKRN